jgi:hypothetical protein
MLQFGTCLFCYHDQTYPATKRMKQYGSHNFTMGHVVWHIRDLITKGTPIGVDGHADDNVGNKRVVLDLGLHSCPDVVCTKHGISQQVDLLTFVNHITMIHQISFIPRPRKHIERTEVNCTFSTTEAMIEFLRYKGDGRRGGHDDIDDDEGTGKGKGKGKASSMTMVPNLQRGGGDPHCPCCPLVSPWRSDHGCAKRCDPWQSYEHHTVSSSW